MRLFLLICGINRLEGLYRRFKGCLQAKEVVKGPWNTGGSEASEDMPRKPLTTSFATNPWLGGHEVFLSCPPASRRVRGLGRSPKVLSKHFLSVSEAAVFLDLDGYYNFLST